MRKSIKGRFGSISLLKRFYYMIYLFINRKFKSQDLPLQAQCSSRQHNQMQGKKSMHGAVDSEAVDPQNRRTPCTRRKTNPNYTFQQPAVSRPKTSKGKAKKSSPSEKPKKRTSLKTSESKNKHEDVCEKNEDLVCRLAESDAELVKERAEHLLTTENVKVLERKAARDLLDQQESFSAAQAECCSVETLLQEQNLDVGISYDMISENLMASQYQLAKERPEYGDLVTRSNEQISDLSGVVQDLIRDLRAARYQLVKERGERLLIAGNAKVLERKAAQDLLDEQERFSAAQAECCSAVTLLQEQNLHLGKSYTESTKNLLATQYQLARERADRLLIARNHKVLEEKAAQDLLDMGKNYDLTMKTLITAQYQLARERADRLLIARNHKVLEEKAAQDLLDMGKNYDLTMKTLIATQYQLAREKADSQQSAAAGKAERKSLKQKAARDLLRQREGFDARQAKHLKTVALLERQVKRLSGVNGNPLASEALEEPTEEAYGSGTIVTTLPTL